jgi:hypothetical protein
MPKDTAKWLTDVIRTEILNDRPELVNDGSGPALNLIWRYERTQDRLITGSCASLRAGGTFTFAFPVEVGVGPKRVTCEYSSANDIRYRSTITLEDRMVVSCEVMVIST